MTTGQGFYLTVDNKYVDIGDNEEIEVLTFEHSIYGLIEYVIYNESKIVTKWTPTEELPQLPIDWESEI